MLLTTFMLLTFATNMSARHESERVKDAIEILKGKSDINTAEWAVDVLNSVSDTAMMPIAKNALAMAYLTGRVLPPDTVKAVRMLEEAICLSSVNACHNLGVYYKNLPRDRQDFHKAYEYFKEGAKNGKGLCCYDVGYMLYKGLGCKQNYVEAIRYFQMDMKHSPSSMYMLALCYRNGYGVERNEVKAQELLQMSSVANYRSAIEEELRDDAEVADDYILSETNQSKSVPDVMPYIESFLNHSSDITGTYNGSIVTYDWSGTNIIKVQPLSITFHKVGNLYSGSLIVTGDTIPLVCTINDCGDLIFQGTSLQMYDRYIESKKADYSVESASLVPLGNGLTGSLRLYSETMGEPDRPMYVSLTKSSCDLSSDKRQCQVTAYPLNGDNVEVCFSLPTDVSSSSVSLYSQSGLLVKHYDAGAMSSGTHSIIIKVPSGKETYIVTMHSDKYHGETLIRIN